MAKYKITAIDEAKGLVTYQILKNDGTVVFTDTRCDLPIEDKVEVDRILSDSATKIVDDYKSSRKADTALKAIVGVEQTAKSVAG
jgi:hypothetical protein